MHNDSSLAEPFAKTGIVLLTNVISV